MAHFLKQSLPKLAQKEQTIVTCSHSIIEMHPRIVLWPENVPRGQEVVSRWSKPIEQTLIFEIQRDPAFKKVDFKKVRHCFSKKGLIL